jgi:hypothetical protein
MNEQSATDKWVDMVFDFTTLTGDHPVIAFMPDFEDPLTITDDIEIYFDDILINNNPNPIKEFDGTIDFEDETFGPLTLHVMGCGDWDNAELHQVSETLIIIDNPDKSGINTSDKVVEFTRRGTTNGGLPWGGFWANSVPEFDITGNSYVHVKVWKPRVSPIRMKLEGGSMGTFELPSMNTQDDVDMWVDMVFDYTDKETSYPIVAFMPDFEDPLAIADDIVIYFDDFIVNNDPNPVSTPEIKHNADFTVYPNPSNGVVNLDVPFNVQTLTIYNVIGQEIKSISDLQKGTVTIDISELDNGLYIINVLNDKNQTITKKILKH